jgi:hypothetical protein
MSSEGPGPRPDDDVDAPWTVSLDDAGPPAGPGGRPPAGLPPAAAPNRRRPALAGLAGVALLFGVAWLPGLGDDPSSDDPSAPAMVGGGLAAPVSLRLPTGVVTTADRSYVGLRLYDGPGGALVTVPTQVVQPSGVRTELPEDPVAWLVGHPKLFVSRVRPVGVAGRAATQVDYRLSREEVGDREFLSVPLFCGWKRELEPGGILALSACTRISAGARVRATFVPVDGRTVLVEAVWPADSSPNGRMPAELRSRYRALLAGMSASP